MIERVEKVGEFFYLFIYFYIYIKIRRGPSLIYNIFFIFIFYIV